MKPYIAILLVSALTLTAAPVSSTHVKAVLLEKLSSFQSRADGLYLVSGDTLRVGTHAIELVPVVESEGSAQGKCIVAMRIEVSIDGVAAPEATFGAIGISSSQEEAIAAGLGEWYLGFGLPLFEAWGEKEPGLAIAGYDVFAGALGLRGSAAIGWIDGSDAMNRKVLEAVISVISRSDGFVTLDLKVMVPAAGDPKSECRVDGRISSETASVLVALDWPRANEGYMFKQAFVLRRRNER